MLGPLTATPLPRAALTLAPEPCMAAFRAARLAAAPEAVPPAEGAVLKLAADGWGAAEGDCRTGGRGACATAGEAAAPRLLSGLPAAVPPAFRIRATCSVLEKSRNTRRTEWTEKAIEYDAVGLAQYPHSPGYKRTMCDKQHFYQLGGCEAAPSACSGATLAALSVSALVVAGDLH